MPKVTRRALLRTGLTLAAANFVPDGAVASANAIISSYADMTSSENIAAIGPREQFLFDFGWKFILGSDSGLLRDFDFNFGKGQSNFATTGAFIFATDKFDDSKWRPLNLPHDWAVELPFIDDESLKSQGYKPLGDKYPDTSIGWYRRTFNIPASDAGRRIFLEFDGAFHNALVFVNGCFIGRNDNGYVPFHFDLSDFLYHGKENFLVVRMDARIRSGWFYEGAGIYRHVWLTKTDTLHLGKWESYVRTEVKADATTLSLATVVENQGKYSENANVRWRILDADGKTVATVDAAPKPIAPDECAAFDATTRLPSPTFWSPERPYLYSAIVSVETAGKSRDVERIRFGVRTIAFDVEKGFFLNGQPVKIKGTCNHQDHAGVGVAVPDRLQGYRLAVLRDMGGNSVRTSHNMPTPEWVEACDRLGMMMMCETRTMSSNPEGLAQLETMIKRYRNSPAIILWSMGNEESILQSKPQGEHIVAHMVKLSHQLDPTRLCTAAVDANYGKGVSLALDVEGINYNLDITDKYHSSHPQQPLIGSETASTISTRGVYITDKLHNRVSAYDINRPDWAELAEEWWKFYAVRRYLAGGFAWTGFDYRGEPTPYSWPSISSQFGIVDTCGFPKDSFFYYKAWWGQRPVLHLFPHWNWEASIGEPVSVWVHSNLDAVELFLNGQSQGSQKVQPLTHLEWKVKYEPGVIEARGSKDGKVVLIEKRETTGTPAIIKLTADRNEIDADNEDIAVLRVEVLDSTGRHVPTANNMISFKITGDGVLLGVGNGDPNCHESDKEPKRSLFNGLAQLIVQSNNTAGAIHIQAYTEKVLLRPALRSAKVTITTNKVDSRPAVT